MAQGKIVAILQNKDTLPKKQRAICDYILEHIHDVDILTTRQLAEAVGIGDATVFRFLKCNGYDSYSEFRSDLHHYAAKSSQSSYWKTLTALSPAALDADDSSLTQVFSSAVEIIERSSTPEMLQKVDEAVGMILSAPKVGFLGLRSSLPVALYFYYLLLPFLSTVQQLSYDEHFIYEKVRQMPAGSVIFVITSWPNTQMTVEVAEFCRKIGHRIILLTNGDTCPIAAHADLVLALPEFSGQYTIAPYILIADALTKEIGMRLRPESLKQLREMDAILAQQGITNWDDE